MLNCDSNKVSNEGGGLLLSSKLTRTLPRTVFGNRGARVAHGTPTRSEPRGEGRESVLLQAGGGGTELQNTGFKLLIIQIKHAF